MKLENGPHLYFPALLVCLILILFRCTNHTEAVTNLPDKIDFNYHVRPILSQNCYVCHGPDSSSREANLRLDTYEGATAALANGGYAIKPHHPRKSKILSRISSEDPSFHMPPPEMKNRLSIKEIAIIEKWIDQGAEWKPHWSFIKPTFNSNKFDDSSPTQIIDGLIQEGKDRRLLSPASQAEPNILLRRVAYLLTGLPPSKLEMDSFLTDEGFNLDEVLDYYLSSIHFGERWARHWMDLMRYAEYMGHEYDYPINGAWHYRDYLIRAFNSDVPYDVFVKEHMAGDLISKPRLHPTEHYNESALATAFYNLGEGKHSPVSIKEEESIRIDNTIDVISKSFLGLTVACAKCHDHKFDPIPTTDYYSMYGMIASARPGPIQAHSKPIHKEVANRIRKLKNSLGEAATELLHQARDKDRTITIKVNDWVIDPMVNDSAYEVLGDFSHGQYATWQSHGLAFGVTPSQKDIHSKPGDRLEISANMASSRSLGSGIPGTLKSQYFNIEHDSIVLLAAGDSSTIRIIVDNFQLIQNPLYGSFQAIVNHKELKPVVLDVSMVKGHKAYIEFIPGYFDQHQYVINPSNYIEASQVIAFNDKNPLVEDAGRISLEKLIEKWDSNSLTIGEMTSLNNLNLKAKIKSKDVKNYSFRLNLMVDSLRENAHFMGVTSGDPVFSPVFNRGNYNDPLPYTVPHRFLTVISADSSQFSQTANSRLQWAEAIVASDNPLTSRVMVNRIWHHIFGRGIVQSVDNFGLQGSLPSHPELLDYLSLLFVEEEWSIKQLIKHILLSETFMQTTNSLASNKTIDPGNIYLHHFPIRRLEAEAIRDGLLATTENLNDSVYGESVPIHLNEFMTGRGRPKASGPLDGNGRRSVYTAIRRNFLSPMMLVFDMPIPFSTFGKRNVTNVPAQSLTLLNDPLVHDQAKKWAENIQKLTSTDIEDKIRLVYQQAFTRNPTEDEIAQAKQFFKNLAKEYQIPQSESFKDLQIWTDYCHSIFNFKEFIYLL